MTTSQEKESKKDVDPLFKIADSPLTVMFKGNPHIKTTFNIALICFGAVIVQNVATYLIDLPRLFKDVHFFQWVFSKSAFTFAIIMLFFGFTSLIQWLAVRIFSGPTRLFVFFETVFMVALYAVPIMMVPKMELNLFMSMAVYIEQVRYSMKYVSLVAENINLPKGSRATLSQFVYFLFAPTLIYRASYPRNNKRSWIKVGFYLTQYIGTLLYTFFVVRTFITNHYRYVGIQPIAIVDLPYLLCMASLVGGTFCFVWWYGFLHCWLNLWAELLRFGDRRFYDEWWTVENFPKYYRKWNLVVSHWLQAYVYHSVHKSTKSRDVSVLVTFLVSAIFHEYVITLASGYMYPVLFVMFAVVGLTFFFVTLRFKLGNIFIIFSIFSGYSILLTFVSIEHYSRINCPSIYTSKIVDQIVPRTWNCVTFEHQN